ncbi:spore coat protein U domain-containing protein [Ectothiorhodospiraceae bacterium 2226]|nr:spore coat protein U domain-containing protein [Ectothiorhodospiraceae bacterium 2226]
MVRATLNGIFFFGLDPTIELTGRGQYLERRMVSERATLAHNLYVDAGRTVIWGDGNGGTGAASGTTGEAPVDHPSTATCRVSRRRCRAATAARSW